MNYDEDFDIEQGISDVNKSLNVYYWSSNNKELLKLIRDFLEKNPNEKLEVYRNPAGFFIKIYDKSLSKEIKCFWIDLTITKGINHKGQHLGIIEIGFDSVKGFIVRHTLYSFKFCFYPQDYNFREMLFNNQIIGFFNYILAVTSEKDYSPTIIVKDLFEKDFNEFVSLLQTIISRKSINQKLKDLWNSLKIKK